MNDLDGLKKDLLHAAGAGGSQLGAKLAADGRAAMELGIAVSSPGPGVAALAKRRGGSATTSVSAPAAAVTSAVSKTAQEAAQGGAELVAGKRR